MGYRSDVRIITGVEGFKKLQEFVENYLKERKLDVKEYNLLNSLDIESKGKEQIYFGWNYVKWYEGDYPDVDAIMDGLDYLEDNDYSIRYMRIGEDREDYDDRYFDGNKEEVNLEYPTMTREFDDDYVMNYLEEPLKEEKEENKEEIDI